MEKKIELYHHGTKGMRWGIRRYQRKDGSLTPAGERRLKKQRAENLEKARKAAAEKRQHDADKERVLKSGSASEVLKYKGELSQQEMQTAINRIRWEQDMKSLSDKEVVVGKSKVEKAMDVVGKSTDYAQKGIKAWNTIANVYNAFSGAPVQLPKISTDITNDNRSARNEEKKKLAEERENKGKKFDLEEFAKDIKSKSDKEVRDASQRAIQEKIIRDRLRDVQREKEDEAKARVERLGNVTLDDFVGPSNVKEGKSRAAEILEELE